MDERPLEALFNYYHGALLLPSHYEEVKATSAGLCFVPILFCLHGCLSVCPCNINETQKICSIMRSSNKIVYVTRVITEEFATEGRGTMR